jgi:hypothetical protein
MIPIYSKTIDKIMSCSASGSEKIAMLLEQYQTLTSAHAQDAFVSALISKMVINRCRAATQRHHYA